jgi:acetyl esterase/lipase
MAVSVRFDPSVPYEVDEADTPFARPGGVDLLARVYRPRGEWASPLAALVDVHGGAWSRGDHTTGALHCRALAASGLVVVSLGFRQGPDHTHPAASADVAAGVRYVVGSSVRGARSVRPTAIRSEGRPRPRTGPRARRARMSAPPPDAGRTWRSRRR